MGVEVLIRMGAHLCTVIFLIIENVQVLFRVLPVNTKQRSLGKSGGERRLDCTVYGKRVM